MSTLTASYLIMTPPGAPAGTEKAIFIRDGFRWSVFFFPAIWLLVHRLWFWGLLAVVLQFSAAALSLSAELAGAGWVLTLAVSLLTALEGPQALARTREERDWTLRTVVSARDLESAEQIYYGDQVSAGAQAPAAVPSIDAPAKAARPPALGLLGYDGE